MTLREIVVGVDGSVESMDAVDWAAREAIARGARLRIVRVWQIETRGRFPFAVTPIPDTALDPERDAVEQAGRAMAVAQRISSLLDIRVETPGGPAAWTLIEHSRDAFMLVLGGTRRGGAGGAGFGSVSIHAVTHARCPVVIVHAWNEPSGLATASRRPVALGYDHSSEALVAAEFAFALARLHALDVVAIEVSPVIDSPVGPDGVGQVERDEACLVAALQPVSQEYPDVAMTPMIARGRPVQTLIDESEHAELLVVGSRGRGRFEGLLLGSVGLSLAHHAHGTLAVVRPTRNA